MEEEKIIVTKETVAEVMKKIDNDEELTTKDKIILQNNPEPINMDDKPRIYKKNRFAGEYTDLGNWNYGNFFDCNPSAYGQTVREKLKQFGQAIANISDNPRIGLFVKSKSPAIFKLYDSREEE